MLTQIIVLLFTISSITFAQSWTQLGSDIDGDEEAALRNDSEGVRVAEYWNGEIDDEMLFAKYPVDVGDRFNERYDDGVLEGYRICTSKNATFEQYNNCYQYKNVYVDNDSGTFYMYFKPNIGWIGEEYIYQGTTYYRSILKSYNIESEGNGGLSPI